MIELVWLVVLAVVQYREHLTDRSVLMLVGVVVAAAAVLESVHSFLCYNI